MNKQYPENASLVSTTHGMLASTVDRDVLATEWRKTWEHPGRWMVTGKTFTLIGNTATNIQLVTWIILDNLNEQKDHPEKTESETASLNLPINEMLISLARNEVIATNGNRYSLLRKEFHKSGDSWQCVLRVKDSNNNETELRRDTIDNETFIHAARAGDIIADTQSNMSNKTFKEVGTNQYQVSIEANGIKYSSSRIFDFNQLFLTATHRDKIITGNQTLVIVCKLCDAVRSNPDYTYISLITA